MESAPFDLNVKQGGTYRRTFQSGQGHLDTTVTPNVWVIDTPDDFTGATARMQIRKKHGDPVLLEVTDVATVDGQITLGAGTIEIWLSDEGTQKLQDSAGKTITKAQYDLKVTYASGDSDYPLAGAVNVEPNITTASTA